MDIRSEFNHVALSDVGLEKAKRLREAFTSLLNTVEDTTMTGREQALARTKLQEAAYWTMKALSLSPMNQVLPLLLVLFAVPAFAQEAAAPKPQGWLETGITLFFTVVLLPFLNQVFGLLKTKLKGSAFSGAVNVFTELVEARAAWLHLKLKDAAADGEITRAELEAIAKELLAQLPGQMQTTLQANLGVAGVVSWAMGLLMNAVLDATHARADVAAAEARARIADVEAAITARKARALGVMEPATP